MQDAQRQCEKALSFFLSIVLSRSCIILARESVQYYISLKGRLDLVGLKYEGLYPHG